MDFYIEEEENLLQKKKVSLFSYIFRYLKRGVNKSGNVANEVDTEQIVCHDHDCCHDDCSGGCPAQVTSIVQNRGSIPLYWSQKASMLNPKPDIVCKCHVR